MSWNAGVAACGLSASAPPGAASASASIDPITPARTGSGISDMIASM